MVKDIVCTFVYKKKGTVVGTKSWIYDDETEATVKARDTMNMFDADVVDVVEVHSYDENAGIFTRYVSVTNKRNDIKWKEVFNARNVYPADFYKCQELAKQVGYKYMLFNGHVYPIGDEITPNNELCEEKDLIV